MDLNESRKRFSSSKPQISDSIDDSRAQVARPLISFDKNRTKTFTALLIIQPVLVLATLSFFYCKSQSHSGSSLFADARVLDPKTSLHTSQSLESQNVSVAANDRLLGGLLPSGFDEGSCLSRYQSFMFRKASPFKLSTYLVSKLRKYEELHRCCGPGTQLYNEALEQLKYGNQSAMATECNYVVWMSYSGLGNRILAVGAAFLYALLSNRVLLVDRATDMTDLFCEPFPSTTWFLPQDFPLYNEFKGFNQTSSRCYGNMLKKNLLNFSADEVPSYLYHHLGHEYKVPDKRFFCDDDQNFLKRVPWLILKTDNYFIPSLYLIPSFEQELFRLFPEKETTFHHLGRYLFHPTNEVWGLITRYYSSYLARADERVGIQIRTFQKGRGPFPHVRDQILSCISKEKILPDISKDGSSVSSLNNPRSIAVVVTSLDVGYSETLRELYWENPTVTGEVVGIHQPSHEGVQQFHQKTHSMKAWAEMYLLSLSDKLVTSGWSTFGYVAQSLGGLRPWILYKPEDMKTPEPACVRAMSIEPCFHSPAFGICKAKTGVDAGGLVPHVRHCEDVSLGLKVVDARDEL